VRYPAFWKELEKFEQTTLDLTRMTDERARILNRADRFASLRDCIIRQKKLEPIGVRAEPHANEKV
jgi:hypothetical protein